MTHKSKPAPKAAPKPSVMQMAKKPMPKPPTKGKPGGTKKGC